MIYTTEIDKEFLATRLLVRKDDSHKGDYGHLLIVAGCETMPGAAVLATGAALKSGCGLVTLHSTVRALQACVVNWPSAMLSENPGALFSELPRDGIGRYNAIAAGPGLGKKPETKAALLELLEAARSRSIPCVLDADALNILSENPAWQELVPVGSVLTPHEGELGRLFPACPGEGQDETISAFCGKSGSTLIRKGYHSRVYLPDGECFRNTSGNPGMAKGGSGDVLTGLVGGLLSRGYTGKDAALLGVWIHGHAGDVLTADHSAEAYNSRDLIDRLDCGFYLLYNQ